MHPAVILPLNQQKNVDAAKAEYLVAALILDMGFRPSPADGKHPSIDGYIQIYHPSLKTHLYIAYQVKTGRSFLRECNRNWIEIELKSEDVESWRGSSIPVILVYVFPHALVTREVYWSDLSRPKMGGKRIRLHASNRFDASAKRELFEFACDRAGHPISPKLTSHPLAPNLVRDIRANAWNCFSSFRRGIKSPRFGTVAVPRRTWQHLTRRSTSQRATAHRLGLLPLAKEIIENTRVTKFLRCTGEINYRRTELHSLQGFYKPGHRSPMRVQVIVELVKLRGKILSATLYSLYESP